MVEEPLKQGFLKRLLGWGKPSAQSVKPEAPIETPAVEPSPPITPVKAPKPRTEAYLNRKKGRRTREEAVEYWKKIVDCLERGGEVSPGDMARELGLPKSTLIYNLNRLLDLCQGNTRKGDNYFSLGHYYRILHEKRLERVGGGKYVRYRLTKDPPQERQGAGN